MKMQITRYSIQIVPETPQDEAFLEIILGFSPNALGGQAEATRVNVVGLSALAYVEIKKP